MIYKREIEIAGRTLSIETGRVARQANGAAWVRYGDTIVQAAVVADKKPVEGKDFFPLMVDYREKTAAAGKIPGGFFKREGRPSEKEILTARLVDRPIRPLFADWYKCETQVMLTVISADGVNDGDTLGLIAASAALSLSDIPFLENAAQVTVGRIEGEFVINPTPEQKEVSDMELVVSGTAESIVMVEGECREVPEGVLLGAIRFAHPFIKQIIDVLDNLAAEAGKPKREDTDPIDNSELENKVVSMTKDRVVVICEIAEKQEREDAMTALTEETIAALEEEYPESESLIGEFIHDVEKAVMRRMVLEEGRRLDGRKIDEIRDITTEVGLLPRVHGSALFTRGQTQALATTTLGSKMDEQRIDSLNGDYFRRFLLHYNFPGFATGETSFRFGVSRRETGHGNLAACALKAVIPTFDEFPYTIRIVSDILESNGSSSMATVCGGCLSLMDAGVPIHKPVAGIAMGLVKEEDQSVILTDILGAEDHLGDMDFKIAGTRDGVTAVQMDIKITGISPELMEEALNRAKTARLFILDKMAETLAEPRKELSPYAPSILFMQIDVDKIGMVIGPGGRNVREIVEKTGATVNIEDDGSIQIASVNQAGAVEARAIIESMTEDPEVGKVYEGTIKKITDFGAFVEILPGKEGLLHVKNIDHYRVNHPSDVLKVGEMVKVKLLDLDSQGKMDLSRKALIPRPEGGYSDSSGRDSSSRKPDYRKDRRPGGGGNRGGGGRGRR
jgi:polyribonucleotide nucleotidyltransferase